MICGKASSGVWTTRRLLELVNGETAIEILRAAQDRLMLMTESPEDLRSADILRSDYPDPQRRIEPLSMLQKLDTLGVITASERLVLQKALKA